MTDCVVNVVKGSPFNLTCKTETDIFNWTASRQDMRGDKKFLVCPGECNSSVIEDMVGNSVKYGDLFENTLQILRASIDLNGLHNFRCQSVGNNSAAEPCNNVLVDVKKKCSHGEATEVNTSLELQDSATASLLANTPTARNVSEPAGFDMDRVCRTLAYNDDEILVTPGYVARDNCRILRASIHQGDGVLFKGPYCGFESCSMAMTIIMRAAILPISQWTRDIVTHSLIAGHRLYSMVMYKTCVKLHPEMIRACFNLPGRYLQVREFDIVTKCVLLFENLFTLHFEDESQLFGTLSDGYNPKSPEEGPGKTLLDALWELFDKHSAGIFIAGNKPIAVISHDNMFYMCDSHACGPDGEPTAEGKACVIQVNSLVALTHFCKRAAGDGSLTFTVEPVDVTVKRPMMPSTSDAQN